MKRILSSIGKIVCCLVIVSCTKNSDDPSENTQISEFSVMSFNIKTSGETGVNSWDNRKAACLAMVTSKTPCLIGMQEVTPVQKSFFDTNLKNYKSLGVARDGSGANTEYSCIYYRTDFFTSVESSTFWLSATPDFMSKGWDGACYRICTWVKLRVKSSGKEFYFFNTHIDHKGSEAQKQGILLLKERIQKIAGDNATVFLTGDFNMQPTNTNIISFGSFMKDTRSQTSGADNTTGTYNGWGSSASIIDYIWYQNSSPISYEVVDGVYEGVTYISDHYPIKGVFGLP